MAQKGGDCRVPAEPKLAFIIGSKPRGLKGVEASSPLPDHQWPFVRLTKASVNMLRIVSHIEQEGMQPWSQCMNWSPCMVTAKSTRREWSWQRTHWFLHLLVNTASSAQRMGFMRSILLGKVSKRQTASYGPSGTLLHKGEMKKSITHLVEGGDAGNGEDQMNRLIRRVS